MNEPDYSVAIITFCIASIFLWGAIVGLIMLFR